MTSKVLHFMNFPVLEYMDDLLMRSCLEDQNTVYNRDIAISPEMGSNHPCQEEFGEKEMWVIDKRLHAVGY